MFNFPEQVTRPQVMTLARVMRASLEGARDDQIHVVAGFSLARDELAGLTGNDAGKFHDLPNAVFSDAIEQLWDGTVDEFDATFDPELVVNKDLARLEQVHDRFKPEACLIDPLFRVTLQQ